jgi:hypothetical protein
MASVFKLDVADFNKTIDRYVQERNVDMVAECNKRSSNIIMKAIQYTKRTNPIKVQAELGARAESALTAKGKVSKRKKFKAFYKGTPVGYKIFNWRRTHRPASLPPKLRGKPIGGKEMGVKYNSFVKAAISSCNYIASGWMPALRYYRALGFGKSQKETKALRTPNQKTSAGKGYAIPAQKAGDYIKSTFANTVNGIEKIGQAALRLAVRVEELDMRAYLERKEQERLNKLR